MKSSHPPGPPMKLNIVTKRKNPRDALSMGLIACWMALGLNAQMLDQIPKSSLSVRPVAAIDSALARSSALFFGEEKPWPVPL